MNPNPPKTFLEGIRKSEHHIKVRWLVVFSVIAMALVLLLWIFYFQATVRIADPQSSAALSTENTAP